MFKWWQTLQSLDRYTHLINKISFPLAHPTTPRGRVYRFHNRQHRSIGDGSLHVKAWYISQLSSELPSLLPWAIYRFSSKQSQCIQGLYYLCLINHRERNKPRVQQREKCYAIRAAMIYYWAMCTLFTNKKYDMVSVCQNTQHQVNVLTRNVGSIK